MITRHDFQGKRVLIAEDDYLLATELAALFAAANARVLGPYASLKDATRFAADTDLAVLDVNLQGEAVFPLADHLMAQRVPFVFCSGFERTLLPARFVDIELVTKPESPLATIDALANSVQPRLTTVADMVPLLRLRARQLIAEPRAADRLLELTLRRATRDLERITVIENPASWLESTMQTVADEYGPRLLH